jgi:hypothetical protein
MNFLPVTRYSISLSLWLIAIAMVKSQTSIAAPAPGDSLMIDNITIPVYQSPDAGLDSMSCILPFSRAGNLILIRAKADSTEGNFILDTGSPMLVLNLTYFRHYVTTVRTDAEEGGMTGTGSPVMETTVKEFNLGPIVYNRMVANLVNLGHIENSKGVKVFGLLGMKLFRQFEMIIDYDRNLIHLHRIGKKEQKSYRHEMLRDTSAYKTYTVDIYNDKVLARTELSGRKLRLLIDFAAETNVLDSRLPDNIFENIAISRRVILNGIGGQRVEALYGDLSNMKLGDDLIRALPVLVTNLSNTCLSYEFCIDGILGFDFLSLHKIGFNFVNRKMYIWK